MPGATVRFQPTPNPNAGKFTVGGGAMVGGGRARTFAGPEDARDHPLAAELLALDGVESVFMVADFVTVTKSAAVDWAGLAPRVEAAIRRHL